MKVSNQRLLNATLVAAALIAGWTMLGWQGVVLAITVIGFWMVLQFNRATRQMRNVAGPRAWSTAWSRCSRSSATA